MNAKKFKCLLSAAVCLTAFTASGCSVGENMKIRKAVAAELDQLKSPESQTITNCISTQDLLPASVESATVSQDIADIFTLFYDNFSFRVKEITVEEDHATAQTQIKNLNSETLAKDFACAALEKHIEQNVMEENIPVSMDDYYLLLKDLLQTNKYKTEKSSVNIDLKKTDDTWQVVHTSELDNLLTGNFLSYVTDPNLLSPSEIAEIHLSTIKSFDSDQLKRYLCLDEVLEEDDAFSAEIADALSEQINRFFDYEITGESVEDAQAVVQTTITSTDIHSIVETYQAELNPWLKTSDALAVGSDARHEKIQEMMLSCIKENEISTSNDIDIHLINDGINWKIQMNSEIASAIFGDIQDAMNAVSADTENEE